MQKDTKGYIHAADRDGTILDFTVHRNNSKNRTLTIIDRGEIPLSG